MRESVIDVDAYLARIGYHGPRAPDLDLPPERVPPPEAEPHVPLPQKRRKVRRTHGIHEALARW